MRVEGATTRVHPQVSCGMESSPPVGQSEPPTGFTARCPQANPSPASAPQGCSLVPIRMAWN